MQQIIFQAYEANHLNACLALFKSNLGNFFAAHEEVDFIEYLKNLSSEDQYYVGKIDDRIVCCGGWDSQPSGYHLRWGMLDNSFHKMGLGKQLLEFRLKQIENLYGKVDVLITTSNSAQGFFEHYGFLTIQTIPNGIAVGIDEVYMRKLA